MLATAWTPEFCTVCYKQCQFGEVYCSTNCRDADSPKHAPEFARNSESLSSELQSAEHDCISDGSEYDEDDELPQLWLTKTRSNDHVCLRQTGQQPQKRREQFLYESPMLRATTTASPNEGLAASPPPSPLLIPAARTVSPEMHMSVQSVNTYKRWLAKSAF